MIILVDARKVIWACGNFAQSPVRIWKTPGELSFLWSYNGHVHCSWSSGDSLHKHSFTLIFSVYDVWMSWWCSVDCSGQLRERQLHWRAFVDADKTASDLVKEMEEKKMVLNRKVCLKHLVVFVRSLFTAFHLVNVCIIFIHTSPRLADSFWPLPFIDIDVASTLYRIFWRSSVLDKSNESCFQSERVEQCWFDRWQNNYNMVTLLGVPFLRSQPQCFWRTPLCGNGFCLQCFDAVG